MKKIFPIIISILIAQAAGFIGAIFTFSSVDTWYLTLNTPSWNPPSWVFGPVWTTLYTLIGISAYLIWRNKDKIKKKLALQVYGIHLVFNALWTILFFGLKNPGFAFAEILILLSLIITTIVLFWRIDKRASYLLLPYLGWVTFASYLNFTIWQLN
ncbi:MAG: benzodiazapine receptor [Oceanicoccus sp.]|jgi:benzodiazapine receptor